MFFRKDKLFEGNKHGLQQLEVNNDTLRAIIEADHLTATQEVVKYLLMEHSVAIGHLKQIRNHKLFRK